jgi:hypothetical protein
MCVCVEYPRLRKKKLSILPKHPDARALFACCSAFVRFGHAINPFLASILPQARHHRYRQLSGPPWPPLLDQEPQAPSYIHVQSDANVSQNLTRASTSSFPSGLLEVDTWLMVEPDTSQLVAKDNATQTLACSPAVQSRRPFVLSTRQTL